MLTNADSSVDELLRALATRTIRITSLAMAARWCWGDEMRDLSLCLSEFLALRWTAAATRGANIRGTSSPPAKTLFR